MTARPSPDRDTLLMWISAYLDGELPAADEALLFDAMSQNPDLLEAFEAMAAAHVPAGSAPSLSAAEADDLVAGVMAATAPEQVPDGLAGALALAQRHIDLVDDDDLEGNDDALGARASGRLFSMLDQKPALAPAVVGFVASADAVQAAARAVAAVPSVVESLRHVAGHVDALVAARARTLELASACADDALTPAEDTELRAALPSFVDVDDAAAVLSLAASVHLRDALRSAAASPAFATLAHKAGAAALHNIEAAAPAPVPVREALVAREPLLARLWRAFGPARAPLAFACAAAGVFFLVSGPERTAASTPSNELATRDALVNALAPRVLADAPSTGDLPLLADNSADVEALDATDTTVVFSTDSSNITVIWVASDDAQGT